MIDIIVNDKHKEDTEYFEKQNKIYLFTLN